jgi:general secretion pathway protein K
MTDKTAFKTVRNQRGVALIVTLTVTTLLVALSLALFQKMNTAYDGSVDVYRRTTLSHMAFSGVQVAMAILAKDKVETKIDSVQEDWADPEVIAEAISELTFDEGNVSVVISDERSRIQVNALVSLPGYDFNPAQFQLWTRLFEFLTNYYEPFEDLEEEDLIQSLKDWIDSGDDDLVTGFGGAESAYYESLDPPYECRNAPLDDLTDFPRIKGFPADLFSTPDVISMVSEVFTVFGSVPSEGQSYTFDGLVNINTAGVIVLSGILPDGYEESYAQDMVQYREETESDEYMNDLTSLTWYQDVSGLEDITLNPKLITNQSDLFRITAIATIENHSLTTTAVVNREAIEKTGKWRCKVLYWGTN